MAVAAQRTADASAEWARLRREALKACGGILDEERGGEPQEGTGEKRSAENTKAERDVKGKRRRIWNDGELPFGVYEPHTGIVLYRSDTQPTRARWEALPDDGEARRVLGGTKAGGGAWGLAWVDTIVELPAENEIDVEGAMTREPYLQLVSNPS